MLSAVSASLRRLFATLSWLNRAERVFSVAELYERIAPLRARSPVTSKLLQAVDD
jgi:hypothetical protein